MSAYVRSALLTLTLSTTALAGGITVYETETNDTFPDAQPANLAEPVIYLSGKLAPRLYFAAEPDTYLVAFNKSELPIAQDNNSSDLGNGKASALYGLTPILDGDQGEPTLRLLVTGRPDGIDGAFNGLFFNSPHLQHGQFTLHIDYYAEFPPRGAPNAPIASETRTAEFITGAEAFRFNFFPPPGTTSIDARIDNTTGTTPVLDDVDHYTIEGLEPLCDYALTVIGGVDHNTCLPSDVVIGWFDKNANLIQTDSNSGPLPQYPQLSALSDASGKLRIAVTGRGDFNFNGLVDFFESPRNIDAPIPATPLTHGVHGCYTIAIEHLIHEDAQPEKPDNLTAQQRLQLERGDLNLDGAVDILDLARLISRFGFPSTP